MPTKCALLKMLGGKSRVTETVSGSFSPSLTIHKPMMMTTNSFHSEEDVTGGLFQNQPKYVRKEESPNIWANSVWCFLRGQ